MNRYIYAAIFALILTGVTSCNGFLEEKVYTEYDPSELLKDQDGVDTLLAGAYARSRIIEYASRNYTFL